MRIIFLNSWFGKVGKPFFDFIKNESPKTDIFCFMEITPDLHNQLSMILKDFDSVYDKGSLLEMKTMCGQTVFVDKKLRLISSGKVSIYRQLTNDIGFMQYLELESPNGRLWVGSVHGKTRPGNKNDTKTRIKQSRTIIDFFKDKKGAKIIGGDFNLNPDTRSVKMLEKTGYKNLIKDFDIKNTRNEISWKQFQDNPGYIKQHFADFVFVSGDVKVNKFEVPYMEISDHLPLILNFEI
jgi:hypothetical protein